MATFSYAGVPFGEVNVLTYSFEPVRDSAGLTVLYQKVTIKVVALMNLNWLADSKSVATPVDDRNAPTAVGVPGNRMGISLERLRHTLGQDRQRLLLRIGPDLVLDSPPPLPDGRRPTRDCNDGPIAGPMDVVQLFGDTSAFVSFTVTTFLNDCSNYILSNNWTMSHSINEFGYTVKTTTGEATLRADFMSLNPTMNADSFRKEFFVPCTTPLQRDGIEASLSEDGKTLNYTLTDVTTTYTITTDGVLRIEGSITAGSEMVYKSSAETMKGLIGGALSGGIFGVAAVGIEMFTPRGRVNFIVRVYGRRDADRNVLFKTGLRVVLSRVNNAFGDGSGRMPASLYASIGVGSHEEPYAEVRGEVFLDNLTFKAILGPSSFADTILNFSHTYDKFSPAYSQTATPTPLIGKDNASGFLTELLAYEPLKANPCDLPAKPSSASGYRETGGPK